jgi:hypothetical protein
MRIYDLKGSIINRNVKINPKIKPTDPLKDENFLGHLKELPVFYKSNPLFMLIVFSSCYLEKKPEIDYVV